MSCVFVQALWCVNVKSLLCIAINNFAGVVNVIRRLCVVPV